MLNRRWRVLVLVCLYVVCCVDCRRHRQRHRRQHQQHYDRRYNRVDVPTTATTTSKPDTQLTEGMWVTEYGILCQPMWETKSTGFRRLAASPGHTSQFVWTFRWEAKNALVNAVAILSSCQQTGLSAKRRRYLGGPQSGIVVVTQDKL